MREDFNENGISVTNVDISNAMIQAMLHNNATKEMLECCNTKILKTS